MKIISFASSLLLCGILCAPLNAQLEPSSMPNTNGNNQQVSIHKLDREALLLVKNELESAKKVLIEIRDSQNPSAARQALSGLGSTLTNLWYFILATAIWGIPVVVILSTIGDHLFDSSAGKIAAAAGFSTLLGTILITYIILKWLLSSSNKNMTAKNINEALLAIDQTINKLSFEIAKVKNLDRELYQGTNDTITAGKTTNRAFLQQ